MVIEELEPCDDDDDDDETKFCDGSCDQSCEHEVDEQPLMKTNNYQFCWKLPGILKLSTFWSEILQHSIFCSL